MNGEDGVAAIVFAAGRARPADKENGDVNPLHAQRRPPLKRTVPQRPPAKSSK